MLTRLQKIVVSLTIIFLVVGVNSLFFYNIYKQTVSTETVPTYRNLNNGGDQMVYFSLIRQSAEGKNILYNLYTNETQVGLISPLWWLIGKMVLVTNISIPIMYYICTILSGALLLGFIFKFGKNIFTKFWQRLMVLPIISLAGGMGIFFIARVLFPISGEPLTELDLFTKTISADLFFGEGFGFTSLRHSPLFILSHLALLLLFWWVAEKIDSAKWWQIVLVGLSVFLLTIVHPYDTVILAVFIMVYGAIYWFNLSKWRNWLKVIPLGLGALLAISYFFYLKSIDPSFMGWSMQNVTRTPFPVSFLAGYIWLLIPAVYGCLLAWRQKNHRLQWLSLWLLVSAVLLFFPGQTQRRFASGVYIPLGILAWYGWLNFWHNKNKYLQAGVAGVYIFLLSSTFFLLIFLNIYTFNNNKLLTTITRGESEAFKVYKNLSNENDIILSKYKTGNLLPAFISRKVYVGHGHQTVNWPEKIYFSNWFFKADGQEKLKHQQLLKRKIDYVWLGLEEKEMGITGLYDEKYFKKMYSNKDVTIYEVVK